jgi:hypothetical protein
MVKLLSGKGFLFMSDVFKFVAGGTVITIVGIIIVAFSEQSPTERMSEVYLRSIGVFNKEAREGCANAAKQHLNTELGSLPDSSGDGQTQVTLTWKLDQGDIKTIACRYERGKGITNLTADGKVVVTQ